MSELREHRWSVLSERGCETSGVNYADAAELVRRLRADKVHGLCVISDEAARRLNSQNNGAPANNNVAANNSAPTLAPVSPESPAPPQQRAARQRKKSAKLS